jgi:hypothetical protein
VPNNLIMSECVAAGCSGRYRARNSLRLCDAHMRLFLALVQDSNGCPVWGCEGATDNGLPCKRHAALFEEWSAPTRTPCMVHGCHELRVGYARLCPEHSREYPWLDDNGLVWCSKPGCTAEGGVNGLCVNHGSVERKKAQRARVRAA